MADLSCFTIGDKFVGIEGNIEIQIVVDHNLKGFARKALPLVFINWFAVNASFRSETVSIDSSPCLELFHEFRGNFFMEFLWNVAERIFQCELCFFL